MNLQLIEINVDYKSWLLHKSRVKKLMYPYNTEMDLSIAIAFYFASSCLKSITSKTILRDKQIDWDTFIQSPNKYITKIENYESKAKVLFSGLEPMNYLLDILVMKPFSTRKKISLTIILIYFMKNYKNH